MVLIQKSISNIRLYDGISINKISKIYNFNKGKYHTINIQQGEIHTEKSL